MPSTTTENRYRAQADFALARLRQYHAAGDGTRFSEWHRGWSLAEAVADAELRERGGGARLLRSGLGAGLRPLPKDLPPFEAPPESVLPFLPERVSSEANPAEPDLPAADGEPTVLPPLPDDLLKRTLLRRAALLQALHAGSPNPFPGEMDAQDWEYHLLIFQEDGPAECELLQRAEEAVEALLEIYPGLPEPEDGTLFLDERGGLTTGSLPVCVEIYRASLLEMSELELRADLYTCLEAGRADTVALIEAEIRRREREDEPELPSLPTPERQSGAEANREDPETDPEPPPVSPGTPPTHSEASQFANGRAVSQPLESRGTAGVPTPAREPGRRRRSVSYSVYPESSAQATPRPQPEPPPVEQPVEGEPEPTPAAYTMGPAWVDATGRTRTWALFDPAGERMGEIATRRDAERLATLLNRLIQRPEREESLPE